MLFKDLLYKMCIHLINNKSEYITEDGTLDGGE